MPAHLLHRGRPGEAGSRGLPLTQNQGCVPGCFSGHSERPQQGVMGTISTVPSVLLFHYFIIHLDLTPCFADLQFGLGDSVLLPCKLMKSWALTVFPLWAAGICNTRTWIYPEGGGSQRSVSSTLPLLAAPSV